MACFANWLGYLCADSFGSGVHHKPRCILLASSSAGVLNALPALCKLCATLNFDMLILCCLVVSRFAIKLCIHFMTWERQRYTNRSLTPNLPFHVLKANHQRLFHWYPVRRNNVLWCVDQWHFCHLWFVWAVYSRVKTSTLPKPYPVHLTLHGSLFHRIWRTGMLLGSPTPPISMLDSTVACSTSVVSACSVNTSTSHCFARP